MDAGFGSFPRLAAAVVRVTTTFSLSSGSLVGRGTLQDSSSGIIVDGGGDHLWIAASSQHLNPDIDVLKRRGAEEAGISIEYASPRLSRISVAWSRSADHDVGEVGVPNPAVVAHGDGLPAAAFPVAVPASFVRGVRDGAGPAALILDALRSAVLPTVGAEVAAVVLFSDVSGLWPVFRRGRIASEQGFLGVTGAVALDIALQPDESGAAVFAATDGAAEFCGLAERVDANTALLVPADRFVEIVTG